MNWNKVKTVLIYLFLAIDIFLVIWNIRLQNEAGAVGKKTIENTAKLLAARGIELPEGTVTEKIPELKGISVRNAVA